MIGSGREPDRNRNNNDFYPTPPFVTNALCRHFNVPKRVWEPAAGRGWMAKELKRNEHSVIATDLFDYNNYVFQVESNIDFLTTKARDVDAIITNPPYERGIPEKFILRALEHDVTFVAMLCRLLFLESEGRKKLFTTHRPSDVLVMSGRFSCDESKFDTDPTGGMVAYAWFVWDKRRYDTPATNLRWCSVNEEYGVWKKQTCTNLSNWIS